jgi:hypothetical protein
MAREETRSQLQRERAALEEARASLKKQEEVVSRLNGELVQLSISHEDQRQALEEREPHSSSCSRRLRRRVGPSRWRRSKLKVSLSPFGSCSLIHSFWDPLPTSSLSCSWLPGLRTALGHTTTRAKMLQAAYNSSQ